VKVKATSGAQEYGASIDMCRERLNISNLSTDSSSSVFNLLL
jgi:hypothetical protein